MLLLSIIVPVYKTEKYLPICISSILQQTFSEFELILIDDGSPDGCPQICDDYAREDVRIKVLHKKNEGLVAARKDGIRIASGKYVGFVDSDDWIDADYYERMVNEAEEVHADVVAVGITNEHSNCSRMNYYWIKNGIYVRDSFLLDHIIYSGEFYLPGLFPSLCTKIFNRELLLHFQMQVSNNVKDGEDCAVSYPLMGKANTIYVDNDNVGYHYRDNIESMSHKYHQGMAGKYEQTVVLYNFYNDVVLREAPKSYEHQLLFLLASIIENTISRVMREEKFHIIKIKHSFDEITEKYEGDYIDFTRILNELPKSTRRILKAFNAKKYWIMMLCWYISELEKRLGILAK